MTKAATATMASDEPKYEAAAFFVPLGELHPWVDNPRWSDKKEFETAVRDLRRSIRRFGFGSPILARKANGEIIVGHTRYEAARRLKMATVPVRFMDLSEAEAHAMAIADNRLGENGKWDDAKLDTELRKLEAEDVDIEDGMGFDDEELAARMADDADDEDKTATNKRGGKGKKSRAPGLKYKLVVECADEDVQASLLERLEAEGFTVKPLMA
jgi:ParB-like chromosome segregation protein Spo0J